MIVSGVPQTTARFDDSPGGFTVVLAVVIIVAQEHKAKSKGNGQ